MGDMNADCGYLNKLNRKNNVLAKDPRFVWLIGDVVDTTTKSTNCAYDRFIFLLTFRMRNRTAFSLINTILSELSLLVKT